MPGNLDRYNLQSKKAALEPFDCTIKKLRKLKLQESVMAKEPDNRRVNNDGRDDHIPPPGFGDADGGVHRTVLDYATPTVDLLRGSIRRPAIQANNFEIKPAMIQMMENHQYFGTDKEDPMKHVKTFMKLTETFRFNGVPTEAIRL